MNDGAALDGVVGAMEGALLGKNDTVLSSGVVGAKEGARLGVSDGIKDDVPLATIEGADELGVEGTVLGELVGFNVSLSPSILLVEGSELGTFEGTSAEEPSCKAEGDNDIGVLDVGERLEDCVVGAKEGALDVGERLEDCVVGAKEGVFDVGERLEDCVVGAREGIMLGISDGMELDDEGTDEIVGEIERTNTGALESVSDGLVLGSKEALIACDGLFEG